MRAVVSSATAAMLVAAVAAFGAALGWSSEAVAQSYPANVENKCTDDYFRFCSSHALGSTGLKRCMEANGRKLSRGCQQALKDAGLARPSRKYSNR